MLFEGAGYDVTSALGFAAGVEQCEKGGFDLFLPGHSIPGSEKKRLVEAFKRLHRAPVISLRRNDGERRVEGADYDIECDPEPLLKLVGKVLRGRTLQ